MPFAPQELTLDTVKGFVDRYLRSQKKLPAPPTWPPKRTAAQETVAQMLGFPNWHALHARLTDPGRSQSHMQRSQEWMLGGDQYVVQDPTALSTAPFAWDNAKEVVALVGSAMDRHHVIHRLRSVQKKSVLWLRSNLAHAASSHTPGYGFMAVNHYDLYAIVDHVLKSWPALDLVDMFMSLVSANEDEDADIWIVRARVLLSAVVSALVYLRDHHAIALTSTSLRQALGLPGLIELTQNTRLPSYLIQALQNYGQSLPDGRGKFPDQLTETALDHHGYLQMQFTRILGTVEELARPVVFSPCQILALNEVEGTVPGMGTEHLALLLRIYIQAWVKENPNGLVVFDGLVPQSPLLVLVQWALNEISGGGQQTRVMVAAAHRQQLPQAQFDHILTVNYQR